MGIKAVNNDIGIGWQKSADISDVELDIAVLYQDKVNIASRQQSTENICLYPHNPGILTICREPSPKRRPCSHAKP